MVALKTFKNLPANRQNEIIDVCLREFAFHGYKGASLGSMINNLNIAKGSFYRYFESKQSLYLFLLEHCAAIRLAHDSTVVTEPSDDLFERMLQHFKGKIKFDRAYSLPSAFLHTVLEEKNNDEITDIQFRSKAKIIKLVKPVIEEQIKVKKIRKDLDIDLMNYMVVQMNLSILEYISFKYKIDYRENIRKGKPLYGISEKEMVKTAQQFMEIFKKGISLHH